MCYTVCMCTLTTEISIESIGGVHGENGQRWKVESKRCGDHGNYVSIAEFTDSSLVYVCIIAATKILVELGSKANREYEEPY